jgi:long-chain acyl-CoA synthetase
VYSNVRNLKNDLAYHQPHWMMLVPRVLEKVATGIQDKFTKKSRLSRMMIHFFTMVATAKNKHLKIAKGQVMSSSTPNVIRRIFSRCIATALSPLDSIGHIVVWNKVKAALGKLSATYKPMQDFGIVHRCRECSVNC